MKSGITTTIEDGVRIISLCPRIDVHNVFEVEDEMIQMVKQEPSLIVVDFSHVEYFGSNGIRILMLSRRILDERGGKMVLACLNPFVTKILRAVDMLDIFDIQSDLNSAQAFLKNS